MVNKTYISYGLRQVRTDTGGADLPVEGPLGVLGEELVGLGEGALAGLVTEGAEGVLEDVGGVGGADHGDGAHVAEFEVLGQPLRALQDDGALGQNVPNAPPDLLLGAAVRHGVRGHVEEQEVALLGPQDALIDQPLAQPLAHLLQLVTDLHEIPGLACISFRGRSARISYG